MILIVDSYPARARILKIATVYNGAAELRTLQAYVRFQVPTPHHITIINAMMPVSCNCCSFLVGGKGTILRVWVPPHIGHFFLKFSYRILTEDGNLFIKYI